jgi:hypothetical protein
LCSFDVFIIAPNCRFVKHNFRKMRYLFFVQIAY